MRISLRGSMFKSECRPLDFFLFYFGRRTQYYYPARLHVNAMVVSRIFISTHLFQQTRAKSSPDSSICL